MRARTVASIALLIAALPAAACDPKGPDVAPDPPILHSSGTLRVLGGSELEDMKPILAGVKAATGVDVDLSYIGTLAGVEQVTTGAAAENFDAVWFGNNQYLTYSPSGAGKIADAKPIMKSPVVLGVRQSVVGQLGWTGKHPSWTEIADAAAAGKLGFGMTNPATSNSGFSGLLSVTAGIAGTTPEQLTTAQVRTSGPRIRKFFGAQRLVSGSSGWLADAYAQRASTEPELNALINYESVLLSLKDKAPLTIVYPSDGAVLADYPLTLLANPPDAVRERYNAVVSYLLQRKTQSDIVARTHRRPVVAGVPDKLPAVTARSIPKNPAVVDALLSEFGSSLRRPARTIYVLDLSESMVLSRIDQSNPNSVTRLRALQDALRGLTRADDSLSSEVLGFQEREQVILLPFDTTVKNPIRYDLPPDQAAAAGVLRKIKAEADSLTADGSTAVYDALLKAYDIAADPAPGNPYTTIVLLSDGERTAGASLDEFVERYPKLPAAAELRVPVFPVLFGTARESEMKRLADVTGGLMFDARKKTSLVDVFREIRGYQ